MWMWPVVEMAASSLQGSWCQTRNGPEAGAFSPRGSGPVGNVVENVSTRYQVI